MVDINTKTLEIAKDDLSTFRVSKAVLPGNLADGEVLFRVDSLALTSNNISYAKSGEQLGYWDFFPTEEGWGRIPGIGWGTVIDSAHPGVSLGARTWGFFPYASHHKIAAGKAGANGFSDVSPNRNRHAPVYTSYEYPSAFPVYEQEREDQDSLLRGLFGTAWLLEDFFVMHDYFGSTACIVTSASSKTSIALAHCIKSRGVAQSIGVTSEANLEFCKQLGCYDQVATYDTIESLDPRRDVVMADFTGNADIIFRLHIHFGDGMKYSSRIGATQRIDTGIRGNLPGAPPKFFFAPRQNEIRKSEVGEERVLMQLYSAYSGFRRFCDDWLETTRIVGEDAIMAAFRATLKGEVSPSTGQVVSMRASPGLARE